MTTKKGEQKRGKRANRATRKKREQTHMYNEKKNQQMADDMQEIYSLLDGFEEHLENVHSLEMFYGDDTLQGLIDHSRQLINSLHDYIYEDSIDEPTDEETSIGALDFDNEPRTEEEETPKI